MIKFSRKNKTPEEAPKQSLFSKFRSGLQKTREKFSDNLTQLISGPVEIDDTLLESLETQLLMADVGIETTTTLLDSLKSATNKNRLVESEQVFDALQGSMKAVLAPCEQSLDTNSAKPFVLLMVGVNGSGKTTTIGKLAKRFQEQGKSLMLAAGDTFRAAAIEQLQAWGQKNNVPVVAQHSGADSASVIFDAYTAAKARNIDILIADTAGRLHTQSGLMDELKKIVRVLKKIDENAPHEILLILDATLGQNALHQAEQFHDAVNLTGIGITKLDGTAKGGILFALANKLQIPIRFIGLGEGVDDLKAFNANEFVEALFETDKSDA
ncbi:MAG: signal recognition particle-docking protein FtsY [Gammaproteobacteria bacterium]